MKRLLIVAAMLAIAVPVTRWYSAGSIEDERHSVALILERQTEEAADRIESDFSSVQADLLDRARAVANDPDARLLLTADLTHSEPSKEIESALIRFQSRHVGTGAISLELYDEDLSLRAWSGASLLPQPDSSSILVDLTAHLRTDPFRKALVLWMPVGTSGFVRAARAVETTTVESTFLGHTDLADRWRSETDLTLEVSFGSEVHGDVSPGSRVVELRNDAAEILGLVSIAPRSAEQHLRMVTRRYRNVEAFWWVLLLAWMAGGLWSIAESRLRRLDPTLRSLLIRAAVRSAIIIGLRYGLLLLDVPGRWFDSTVLASWFDPTFLASEFGWGAASSVGDLLVTTLAFFALSVAWFDAVLRYRPRRLERTTGIRLAAALATVAVIVASMIFHARLTRESMLDTTLDFFAWTGLLPQPLVLAVFCSLLLSTVAVVIVGISALGWYGKWSHLDEEETPIGDALLPLAASSVIVLAMVLLMNLNGAISGWSVLLFACAMVWPARLLVVRRPVWVRVLRIRSVLITLIVAVLLLYPLLYSGMAEQRRLRLVDATDNFAAESDAQAVTMLESALEAVAQTGEARALMSGVSNPDSVMERLARRLPLVEMIPGIHHVEVAFYQPDLTPIGAYDLYRRSPMTLNRSPETPSDSLEAHLASGQLGTTTHRDERLRETSGYSGIIPVELGDEDRPGWIGLRLDRRSIRSPFGSLFGYPDWRRSLALAEFRDGRRVRTEGERFEPYLLPREVEEALDDEAEFWQTEDVFGSRYLTYYRVEALNGAAAGPTVVAARARAIIPYDHLYYLLRLAIAGLWLAAPVYLAGLAIRWRLGLIPSRRRPYGDRVLDAFMVVGVLAVAGMGLVGQQVIMRENDGAINSRLDRRLQRVEDALVRAAKPGEALYEVERRVSLDSLARQLSLDLTVYRGPWLVETSTPITHAGPLMGYRLPGEAYDQLFVWRFRQAFVESSNQFGEVFTVGYKALSDDDGWPQSVVAVLTFPEQARIREERARTTAYLFGALLLLLLVIMATATSLARALTGPLRRLRDGMQSVAAGRVQKPIPVESRDEVGQLVETFNVMQDQLSESRRKLAQQERELAWSEMARQVAHEIKNPLTPMKLSIQHLQRAFEEFKSGDTTGRQRFAQAFDRITNTVSEQIDTLAHIANEFSTFARLPSRHVEVLDPNKIVAEAVELTSAELLSGIRLREVRGAVFVEADRDELRRVLINLLKNAVQSVDPDEGRVDVRTRLAAGLGDRPAVRVILIEVRDNGPGIEPDVRPRIFQPNFSTKTSGMGLGLAIAKKSVEAMGGDIGFKTEVGSGTTFWIRLPLV